jgi:hypothetical protein
MTRPNVRFSIVVFGAGLVYTLLNWIPGIEHGSGLNLPVLLISLGIMGATVLALDAAQIGSR